MKVEQTIATPLDKTINLESSEAVARNKLEKITREEFSDFVVRAMSFLEFKDILKNGRIEDGKEVYMPNHFFNLDKVSKRESYIESFSHFLRRDQMQSKMEVDLAAQLLKTYGTPDQQEPTSISDRLSVKKEDWFKRIQEQTLETSVNVNGYDVLLIMDVNIVGKPNLKGDSLPWGFIDNQSNKHDQDILAVIEIKGKTDNLEELVRICSEAGDNSCPVFSSDGLVIFPK